jgi:hypothetical protein
VASIKIISHKHIRVMTEWSDFGADQADIKDYKESVRDTVTARFEIVGGEPIKKSNRAATSIRPHTLIVEYLSINGGFWSEGTNAYIDGTNVKKDGSDGAEAVVRFYDFPTWARELYRGDCPVLAWLQNEYPR